jgi:hypothetical protein
MDLTAFQELVLREPVLQSALVDLLDEDAFSAAVCAAAQARGLDVQPQDVQAALLAARRAWIERWIL